jgi:hypothetical protein
MGRLIQKRMCGAMEGEFVVFLIGMRVNRWWKVWRWLRISLQSRRMMRELAAHPELGYLGGEEWLSRTTVQVQYWRSMEQLLAYAHSRDAAHLPAWRDFNKLIGTNGDVGIWHETYRVRPGDYESMYTNMPPFGLGRAGALLEATGPRESARDRLASAA